MIPNSGKSPTDAVAISSKAEPSSEIGSGLPPQLQQHHAAQHRARGERDRDARADRRRRAPTRHARGLVPQVGMAWAAVATNRKDPLANAKNFIAASRQIFEL